MSLGHQVSILCELSLLSFKIYLCFLSQIEPGLPLPLPPPPPFPQTWFQMCASPRSSQRTRKHCRGVDMRQMELNNAGGSQASLAFRAGLASSFKSLLLANWE